MRILHTSDWHLGHTLHAESRAFEHRAFLDWLLGQLRERAVDALLLAGDVFDTANPSAASQGLYYSFLAEALKARPGLQIVAIAGNHDSAARLEAPDHLLRQFDIRVVGSLPRRPDGEFDPAGVLVELKDRGGDPRAVVIAMPFLRAGDLPQAASPALAEDLDPLVEGVRSLYAQALEAAQARGLPIIAMGHAYLVEGRLSELSERKVLGGNQHALPTSLFPEGLAYVALGHLHLPQALGAGRIRFSGSPIPLSMSERHYPHSVTLLDLAADGGVAQAQLPIPRAVAFLRVPDRDFLPLDALLERLAALPDQDAPGPPAFLEVGLQLLQPEASKLQVLEAALAGKGCRLVKIATQYTGTGLALGDAPQIHGLRDLAVEEVFQRKWTRDFRTDIPAGFLAALHELIDQVGQEGQR